MRVPAHPPLRRVAVALCLAASGLAVGQGPAPAPAAGQVVIYRCTDSRGAVTLSDAPCPKGQSQQRREMVRPQDAPARPKPADPPPVATVEAPPPRVIVVQPPRPLYQCTTPDGQQYLSETAAGNPRFVPLWTLDVPVRVPVYEPGRAEIRIDDGRVSGSITTGGVGEVLTPAGQGAGTWVSDACAPLPQAEVCAQLRDRRDELRRRFFNAQPSERAQLSREERALNARLDEDCP